MTSQVSLPRLVKVTVLSIGDLGFGHGHQGGTHILPECFGATIGLGSRLPRQNICSRSAPRPTDYCTQTVGAFGTVKRSGKRIQYRSRDHRTASAQNVPRRPHATESVVKGVRL
ncbi:hypothetical protein BAUCODRAFT_438880 [Baudoinia panamericana UAMH 10762]|uniref:Uncharacterized protein n=1 Tax=Baudoinia panamericana (strain UAMH 10762) TaxID=717646 RepID=M2MZQ7_BAUPA|nr:uncharacterized protein BAUCODRAFT_438880 [Baudoinia panamericana UAMH 10762]EMC97113.1 hypothetical protein BAUCODRAFT_438880 [Baudoinia panamericana UAMH 10762]